MPHAMLSKHFSVSVIIPVYNGREFISRAIHSVQNQTIDAVKEIIIVDDGSSDGTAAVVREDAAIDTRIRFLQQPNRGQASARNAGASVATEPYLAFLDADDTWTAEKLELQLPLFGKQNALAFVFGNAAIIHEGKENVPYPQFKLLKPTRGNIYPKLLFGCFVNTSTVIIRRDVFSALSGFAESGKYALMEDYDFWLRAAQRGNADYVPEVVAYYYRRSGSSSHRKVRTAAKVLRLLLEQPVSWMQKVFPCLRQVLVLFMYVFRVDRFLSPL